MMLRNKNIFFVKEVDYGVLQTNGEVTVLKKRGQLTVAKFI